MKVPTYVLPKDSADGGALRKWLMFFDESKFKDFSAAWADAETKLLDAARKMENEMLALLMGVLEGETNVEVAEHLLETLDQVVLISLLNIHWRKKKGAKINSPSYRRHLLSAAVEDSSAENLQTEADLSFFYYSLAEVLTEE